MRTTLKLSEIVKEWLRNSDLSEASRSDYQRKIGLWFRWLSTQQEDVREAGRPQLLVYKQHLQREGKSHYTVNTYITIVKLFYRYCSQVNYWDNIGNGVKSSTRYKHHTREALTQAEAAMLLDSIETETLMGKRDKLIVALMLTNGIRTVEVERINRGDFFRQGNQTFLHLQRKGRTDKREQIVIPDWVVQLKSEYLDALTLRANLKETDPLIVNLSLTTHFTRLGRIAIGAMVKKHLKAIGIDRIEIIAHSLRHTCASLLIEHGIEIEYIRDLLGHSDSATTRIYMEMAAKRKMRENSPSNLIADLLSKRK